MAVKTMRTNYLYVRDNVEIGDDLTVTDDVSIGGDLTITGALTVYGNFTFGDATIDTLLMEGLLDCNSQATFQSSVTFSSYTMHSATQKSYFRDSDISISSTTDGQLDVDANGEVEITSPILDVNASTGLALDGANLNSSWTVNTTNKIYFKDTGNYIYSPKDAHLSMVTDGSLFISSGTITTGTVCLINSSTTGCYFAVERLDGVTSKSGIKIGQYWLYVNSTDSLCIATSQPTSDTSGTAIYH